jgi:hypothetical protein
MLAWIFGVLRSASPFGSGSPKPREVAEFATPPNTAGATCSDRCGLALLEIVDFDRVLQKARHEDPFALGVEADVRWALEISQRHDERAT